MRRGWKAFPSQTGAIFERTTPRIATSGALTIGVKAVPPMPPSEEMVKVAPCISAGASLPARAFSESAPSSRASSIDALLVDVLDDRDDEAVGRVDGDADVPIAAQNQGVAAGTESGVEGREGFQRRDRGPHEKRQQRHAVRL